MRTLTLCFLLAASSLLQGGGFWIEFGNPTASKDASAAKAAVLVRAVGCHNPELATFSGSAEGTVGGQRQTVPLKFSRLSGQPIFAVERNWPKDGEWVLHIESKKDGLVAKSTARVLADGSVERPKPH